MVLTSTAARSMSMRRVAGQSTPVRTGKAENAAEAADVGNYGATIQPRTSERLSRKKGGAMWKWNRKDENKSAPAIPSAVSPVRSIPSHESVQIAPTLQSVERFVTAG